jgi:hypothetical protein
VPKPVLQALVLAEHVYQDKLTGNSVIAGTFNRLHVFKRGLPSDGVSQPVQDVGGRLDGLRKLAPHEISKVGSPWVYISLTEIYGTIPLELRYVDLVDNVVLLRVEMSAKSESPLDTLEAVVRLPPLPTPHPGTYALELLSNDEPLGSHRVTVVEMPASDTKAGEEKT